MTFDISIFGLGFNEAFAFYLQLVDCLSLTLGLLVNCEHPSILSPAYICLGKVHLSSTFKGKPSMENIARIAKLP